MKALGPLALTDTKQDYIAPSIVRYTICSLIDCSMSMTAPRVIAFSFTRDILSQLEAIEADEAISKQAALEAEVPLSAFGEPCLPAIPTSNDPQD